MSFNEKLRSSTSPGRAERWLRRIFVEDWNLKLLALAITLVLWFVVAGHEIERELTVKPRLEGTPLVGYEVKNVTITPAQVKTRGPAADVDSLQEAFTDKVSITGRRESFDAPHTSVYTLDSKVEVLETVNVHVEIGAVGANKAKS